MQASEKAVILAHISERAEQYDEMAKHMKDRVQMGTPLSAQERDLLSAAYKGALAGRRQAVRVAAVTEQQEKKEDHVDRAALAQGYRAKVEAELQGICKEVIALLQDDLVPQAETGEPKAFYLKMQGDYCRYQVESSRGLPREMVVQEALDAYSQAKAEAEGHLLTTSPVRLGIALNYSVFQHEVLGDTNSAITTAEEALGSASKDVANMPEEAVRDASLNMQLLQDNLALWHQVQQQA